MADEEHAPAEETVVTEDVTPEDAVAIAEDAPAEEAAAPEVTDVPEETSAVQEVEEVTQDVDAAAEYEKEQHDDTGELEAVPVDDHEPPDDEQPAEQPPFEQEEAAEAEGRVEVEGEDRASMHEEAPADVPADEEQVAVDDYGEDLPLTGSAQLADEPCQVMAYPSSDIIDVLSEMSAAKIKRSSDADELAILDAGDQPDPTRKDEKIGPVHECPEIPTPPPLLLEGEDDIEKSRDEVAMPSILVDIIASFMSFGVLAVAVGILLLQVFTFVEHA